MPTPSSNVFGEDLDPTKRSDDDPLKISSPKRQRFLSDITEKYLHNTSAQERQDFSDAYGRKIVPKIDAVYLDLPMLYDIYLGGLLLMTKSDPAAFAHIVDQIPQYGNRLDGWHAKYFPKLGIDEATLLAYITSKDHVDTVLMASPPTDIWEGLSKLAFDIYKANQIAKAVHPVVADVVDWYVNFYPLRPTMLALKDFKVKFTEGLCAKEFQLKVISCDPRNMPLEIYHRCGYFFVYRYNDWLEDPETVAYDQVVKQWTINNATVYGYPTITNQQLLKDIVNMSMDEITRAEKNSALMLNIHTKFFYLRPQVESFGRLWQAKHGNELKDTLEKSQHKGSQP